MFSATEFNSARRFPVESAPEKGGGDGLGGGGGDGGGAKFVKVTVARAASLVAPLLSATRTTTSLSPAGRSVSSAFELCVAPRGVSVSTPSTNVTRKNEYVKG